MWKILVGGFVGGILPTVMFAITKLQSGSDSTLPPAFLLLCLLTGFVGLVVAYALGSPDGKQAILAGISAPGIIAGAVAGNGIPNKPLIRPNPVSAVEQQANPTPTAVRQGWFGASTVFAQTAAPGVLSTTSTTSPTPSAMPTMLNLRTVSVEAVLSPSIAALAAYNMIFQTGGVTQAFPLGRRVTIPVVNEASVGATLIANEYRRPFTLQAGDITVCLTSIQAGLAGSLLGKLGLSTTEIYPQSFDISFLPGPAGVCQDTRLNSDINVYVQWRQQHVINVPQGQDEPPVPESLGKLVKILKDANFKVYGPEVKGYVGNYKDTPRLVVYWHAEDQFAAAKIAETSNAWRDGSDPNGPQFVVSDQTGLRPPSSEPIHNISLQVWYP